MKKLNKVLILVMALIMTLAMSASVFAAGTGSITITPPDKVDKTKTITYNIYKVFDANGNGSAISYKLVDGKTTPPAGFSVDAAGNVSLVRTTGDLTKLTADEIAAIKAYVTEDDLVTTATSTNGAAAVAQNLPNGYYYITTTTGTVVTIDTTNPSASVEDKNTVPSVDKKITGASSYDADGKKALAQVGTQVSFQADVTVGKGQLNYVFKDTLGTGLAYVDGSLAVAGMTAGTDYTLTVSGQNITVAFNNDSIKDLTEGSKITVTYKATVTSDALQEKPAENTATISYGNNSQYTSEPSKTETYNAKISVIKYEPAKEGEEGAVLIEGKYYKPLAGAGFVLKNAAGKYYKIDSGVVSWVDTEAQATEYTSGADGKLNGEYTGLADGTYTIVEKTVPAGYNKAADQDVTIAKGDYSVENLKQEAKVVNNPGTIMPATGGIGTTIFYILGSLLVVGCGIVLVSRKRMQNNK